MPIPSTKVLSRLRATCVVALLLVAATARAALVFWDGPAVGGSWTTAMNWSTDAVPTAADEVTISGATVTVSDARTVAGLTLADDAQLDVGGIGASLDVIGPANIDNGRLVAMDF